MMTILSKQSINFIFSIYNYKHFIKNIFISGIILIISNKITAQHLALSIFAQVLYNFTDNTVLYTPHIWPNCSTLVLVNSCTR